MYHIPVMLNECIEGLNIQPNGIYVDVTFEAEGIQKILEQLNDAGKLFAFDVDEDAKRNIIDDKKRFTLVQANYKHLKRF